MRFLRMCAIVALAGFGAGLLLIQPARTPLSTAYAYVPNVPLMAVYDTRSANPDGSGVFGTSKLIAVRRDGSRAIIWTIRLPHGSVLLREIYDPATQTRVDVRESLGIKSTWPRQPTDPLSIVVSSCSPLPGSETIKVLGYTAVQDWHQQDTLSNGFAVVSGWRIPELGCLRATTVLQDRAIDGSSGRNGEDRLVWLSLADPPDSLFAVPDQLEEVSPAEEWERYVRAGLVSASQPVYTATKQSDLAYRVFNGKIDRATALDEWQQIDANQIPGQP